jgi:opacity protein-like surface antigen
MMIESVGVRCKRTEVFILFVFALVIAASSLSAGQVAPRWDFYGGYSYLRFDSPSIGYAHWSNLNGFAGEVTFNINPRLGVTLDGNGDYGNHLTVYNYMFGPQYTWRRDKSAFFAHGFFGKAQNTVNIETATRNGFGGVGRAFAAGGGYDWNLTPRFTLRVEGDYLNTSTFGATQNSIRISTGLVFHHGQIGRRPKL